MKRIVITTEEMFDNCFNVIQGLMWENPEVEIPNLISTVRVLASGDMLGIRKAFTEFTAILMGRKMNKVEGNPTREIEVVHNEEPIGVLISREIIW